MIKTDALPAGTTVRHPVSTDVDAILALIIACDLDEFGVSQATRERLHSAWQDLDLDRDSWVVLAPGGWIVGYATVQAQAKVQIEGNGYVHPEHVGRGIGTYLLRRIEARAREYISLAQPGLRVNLWNTIAGPNQAAHRLLEAQGYMPERQFRQMLIEMCGKPSAPEWPRGAHLRPFRTGEDDHRVYEAIREAFRDKWGYLPQTFKIWRSHTIEREGFDPTLWFVAMIGGEIAGVALCDDRLTMGWVRNLAVRRPWRRQGLGMALLRQSFGEFYRRQRNRVGLWVDTASPTGAPRLYERAGMHVAQQYDSFTKVLRPGATESPVEPDVVSGEEVVLPRS